MNRDPKQERESADRSQVKAIVFDVFGTVVDWRSSIINKISAVGERLQVSGDWGNFADEWRGGYHDGVKSVLNKKRDWVKADAMHMERLRALMKEHDLTGRLSEEETVHLNQAWHRLTPWPDSAEGLTRLKKKFIIGTLSNGNTAILVNMAKNAKLPWDIILSGENFRSYKPDPKVYLGVADLLGLETHEVMVVAAHLADLNNARKHGLKTGFVARPDEYGNSGVKADLTANTGIDIEAADFIDLARKMGA